MEQLLLKILPTKNIIKMRKHGADLNSTHSGVGSYDQKCSLACFSRMPTSTRLVCTGQVLHGVPGKQCRQ